MWRSLAGAMLIYGYGHAGFDGYRPASLDAPLQNFHREINGAARDGKRALETLDDARSMRYLKGYIDALDTRLRGG